MQDRLSVKCPLEHGLHARPASALAEAAARFEADVTLTNERTGRRANAKSVIELVAAGVMSGDVCGIDCNGEDAEAACSALAMFLETTILEHDTPLPAMPASAAGRVPRDLRDCAARKITGTPASPGLGRGKLLHYGAQRISDAMLDARAADPAVELAHADEAFERAIENLRQSPRGENPTAGAIRKAMRALASDPALRDMVAGLIQSHQRTAATAVLLAVEEFAGKLRQSASAYLRERAADLTDIGQMVLANLPGATQSSADLELSEPTIVVARSLATSAMLNVDRENLAGLVLGEAGTTAHVVILARSFGIPCICGADTVALAGVSGAAVIDGALGFLASPVSAEVERYLQLEQKISERIKAQESEARDTETLTSDGRRVEIAANIATAEEAYSARARGAEGVGLFRTEMLFAFAGKEPTEAEQYEVYSAAARAMDGRTVVIRTLDVGGDKPLPYLDLPQEMNPFLGYRGIRIYADHPELFSRHLRAIIRASAHGKVWIMAPMVSGPAEARWFVEQVRKQQRALEKEGVEFDPEMRVGVMIEIPSAAIQADQLCDSVDFFSVGTNDLTQYLLAAERGNPAIASCYEELHPALVRLLHSLVEAAHARGKWVGLCGELARNPRYTPLLVGLGFDELSMSVPAIAAVKSAVARCSFRQCRELAALAVNCPTAGDVRSALGRYVAAGRPLLDAGLIRIGADCRTRAEAIRELCAVVRLGGRCADLNELEDAVWAREETYSTGLGHGIAVPHCKSDAVAAASLAVLKLDQAIEWGAVDDRPVDIVLMLAMPEGDDDNRHLQVFATLARRLMHEEFRDGLRFAADADGIISFLNQELGIEAPEGQIDE